MPGRLRGKKALITGASSGIGAGVAVAFAKEGADVVINYPNKSQEKNAKKVAAEVRKQKRKVFLIQADVSKEAPVKKMVNTALKKLGHIDILVNNAGIATGAPVEKMPVSMWDQMININLRSVFLCTHFVLPHMYKRNKGKIVSTASQLAYLGSQNFGHYCATKAAIIAFTKSLSREIGKRNINANCVAPGATYTPLLEDVEDDHLAAIKSMIPKGELAKVEQIIPAFIYLASEEASHMVGQTISPNGGDSMV
ncbi:MAG: 3-oxoacyl-ACP reductase [Rhodospirillaceae bacterium]|nr:3-oxoacyl-ACP reductase [Rhodospirillaceae bacterium]|tara:strand:+ start:67 stop:825 length:759 start_codon:yes stop_codon:yes gene_type:complete